jgi:predicted phage replisome organizer
MIKMAEVKWIKIVPDVFDDDKIKLIENMPEGDSIIVIWFKLLCLAGKQNRDGFLLLNDKIAYTDEMLSTIFRRPLNTVRLALNTFEQFDMIEIVNGAVYVTKWEKHQNVDKLAELREYNRLAQQKSRAKKKLLPGNKDVNDKSMTSQPSQGIDVEEEKEENKDFITTTTTETREGEPSVFEVSKYLEDTDPRFHTKSEAYTEANKFYAYNAMRGWDCLPDWQKAADLWLARIDDKKG